MNNNIAVKKSEKTRNILLLLVSFAIPILLAFLTPLIDNVSKEPLYMYFTAGILFGCAIVGFLFIVSDSGNTALWKMYTPFALFTGLSFLFIALAQSPSDTVRPIIDRGYIIFENIFFADYIFAFMPIVINKSPFFVPRKNGNGKRPSAVNFLLVFFVALNLLLSFVNMLGKLFTLNGGGKYFEPGKKLLYMYENNFSAIEMISITGAILLPFCLGVHYFLRDRALRIKEYGKKNASIGTLAGTVNGNYLIICIVNVIVFIPFIFVSYYEEMLPILSYINDTFTNIQMLYPCLFFLIAFLSDMRRTKDKLQISILSEQEARLEAEEKEREKLEAERANKEKSSFLANMSHEIRTPINGILGITQIELDKNPPEEIKKSLEMIYSSGKSLLDIINDILDFSKIESGKIEITLAPYDFGSMINDTMVLNVTRIGSKPIKFTADIDPNIPAEPVGDYVRIKQVLNNLLSNAFKYTAEGEVKLSVSLKGENIVFAVSDTGQGLSPESVKKLGEAYVRFNENANVSIEGTGLGMNITRKLIDKMGGTLEIESELGKGSTFIVTLPNKTTGDSVIIGRETAEKLCNFDFVSARTVADVSEVTAMPYGKVLVVDDNATNLFVAEGLLAEYKLNVTTVMSGFEAIHKINEGEIYDIIFMDHMMPQMDGVETVKKLRDMGYTAPIMALTANALSGIDKMFIENGFDGFISKPIEKKSLNNALIKYVKERHPDEINSQVITADNNKSTEIDRRQRLTEYFLIDANNALKVLPDSAENDISLFAITAHAMKSAFANMGNSDLSDRAKELEFAGKDGDRQLISEKLPEFLADLQSYVNELTPQAEDSDRHSGTNTISEEQKQKLLSALDEYDEDTANALIAEIRANSPNGEIISLLSEISQKMMVSEFEEAAVTLEKIST
jgi:signal transduction histidine kinase/CheY-like chemotaxis protein